LTDTRDERSDEDLVDACNRGDAAEAARAFEVLYRRHRSYVLRVAGRFVRDRDLALDVLQETFTYLLRKFPPTGPGLVLTAGLQTLLYPVAKHSALSLARAALPAGDDPAPIALEDLPDSSDPAPPAAANSSVDAALARLSAQHREVLTLRFVDDLSLAEIAAALELPLGTVKSRLHLAIRRLRSDPEIRQLFEQ
jgi:RNA polymerase sigma-70 factor (ECF subfamily)